MPSWVLPAVRWQTVSPADDIVGWLAATGDHLVTWPPGPFEQTPTYCYRLGQQYWIWQPDVGGVAFTADRPDLLLQPLTDTDPLKFEQLVSRSWLPAVYPIWNRQVLHASAVASRTGDVIAFTGPSGACKSTTAYGLSQRTRWTMVADDTLAFSCSDAANEPIALHPLRSEARLRHATATHFGQPEAIEIPFTWPAMPLRLKAIYALDASDNPETSVAFTPLRAAESFPLLLAQAHALSLCVPEHNQRLMRDYLSLAADVPAFRFTFPKCFAALELNFDALEAHAATHGVDLELTASVAGRPGAASTAGE